jgi:ABC-type branched-subunit amino acid transport system ATPase component
MSNILEVNKVVKRYGDYVALNEVSMSIQEEVSTDFRSKAEKRLIRI